MAYYSQAEFARITGKAPAYISTYITRGKLVKSGDVIDDNIEPNKGFLKKHRINPDLVVVKKKDKKKTTKSKPPPKIEDPKTEDTTGPKIEPPDVDKDGQYELGMDKIKADIALKESNTRLKLLEERKKMGELIPIDLVKNIVSKFSQSIIKMYKESADEILMEVAHRTKMTSNHSAELKGELIKLINAAHEKAIAEAKKSFEDNVPNF